MNKRKLKQQQVPGTVPELLDTHRLVEKYKGGEYVNGNVVVTDPVSHMKIHGNYRKRIALLENLKILIDAREHLMKQKNGADNRLRAMHRNTDQLDQTTEQFLQAQSAAISSQLSKHDRRITKELRNIAGSHPIIDRTLAIPGIGPITVAYLIVYVDITKAKHASSLWSYVGYDKASHERYEKNVAGGGNKTLRTILYNTACSMEKNRNSPYRVVYENEKVKLAASKKLVKSRNTQGKLVEVEWKDAKPGHRRMAAMRKAMKHFLADFWYVWRTLEGLDTRPLYVQEKLGHTGIVKPEERCWKLK
tara:strand:+ start:269 stop:1183 length:915 start_codon:yes stop_codon:yes gene_type:complete